MASTIGDKTPSQQIDDLVRKELGWKGLILSQMRTVISAADPAVVEEVKWKKPSNPAGVPVWYHNGIVCFGNVLKNAVRLTFPKGAQMSDPTKVFNVRLDSKTVRAVDFHEGDKVNEAALKKLVVLAVELNMQDKGKK